MSTLQNLRKYKIFKISLFDLITAFIGMVLIALLLHRLFFRDKSVWLFVIIALLATIPLGILVHYIFHVNTTLNYKLGLSDKPKDF